MNAKMNITDKFPNMLHGGDYNPEQWLKDPEILAEDLRLMKEAKINCVTLGVFSWSMLEPKENVYDFDWLEKIINTLYENGIYTILSTPSGARPVWMTHSYPEVSRIEKNLIRNLHGGRHNHCYTSPVYRRKTREINEKLSERFSSNPAVIMWHISNEIQGQCYCDLCQEAFRSWLKEKYNNDLEALNDAWYTIFWSQKYTEWSQIQAPVMHGMPVLHGLNLDWNRFCTEQSIDFYKNEVDAVHKYNPNIPCTINMMGLYTGIDYNAFAKEVDVISWDSYPCWHNGDDYTNAITTAFNHDLMRSFKQQPFMVMENTPSTANWCGVSRLRQPNLLELTSMQSIAHGSNTVQYFQIRQSRGSCEKWHSAVISHRGTNDTMTFKNVATVGDDIEKLNEMIYHSDIEAKVGIIFDTENAWAIQDSKGPRNEGMHYTDLVIDHYSAFWDEGINCDVIDSTADFSKYDLLIAPMLYMLKDGVADRLKTFVKGGKTLVSTCFTGLVDKTDLCHVGVVPAGGLDEVFGLWQEDIDALYDGQSNEIAIEEKDTGFKGTYKANYLCDLVHPTTATVLGTYTKDWYAGWPALLANDYEQGKAIYITSIVDKSMLKRFYKRVCESLNIKKNFDAELPKGVTVGKRSNKSEDIYFFQNFNNCDNIISLKDTKLTNVLTGEKISGRILLKPYGCVVAKITKKGRSKKSTKKIVAAVKKPVSAVKNTAKKVKSTTKSDGTPKKRVGRPKKVK